MRQGDQRKQFLFEKKILDNSKNGSLDRSCYEAIDSSISQNVFSYLKMFSMQFRKRITVEDNKKRMNIANTINIYTNIYTCIICDENDSKQSDSIN